VPSVKLISSFGEGDTCYIGSRLSDMFLRIYDKERESKDECYIGAVRFEAELKGAYALKAYQLLSRSDPASGAALSVVVGCFKRHGIDLPVNLPLACTYNPVVPLKTFDLDRTAAWLQRQVAPALQRCLTEGMSWGKIEELLGLQVGAVRDVYVKAARQAQAQDAQAWSDALSDGYASGADCGATVDD